MSINRILPQQNNDAKLAEAKTLADIDKYDAELVGLASSSLGARKYKDSIKAAYLSPSPVIQARARALLERAEINDNFFSSEKFESKSVISRASHGADNLLAVFDSAVYFYKQGKKEIALTLFARFILQETFKYQGNGKPEFTLSLKEIEWRRDYALRVISMSTSRKSRYGVSLLFLLIKAMPGSDSNSKPIHLLLKKTNEVQSSPDSVMAALFHVYFPAFESHYEKTIIEAFGYQPSFFGRPLPENDWCKLAFKNKTAVIIALKTNPDLKEAQSVAKKGASDSKSVALVVAPPSSAAAPAAIDHQSDAKAQKPPDPMTLDDLDFFLLQHPGDTKALEFLFSYSILHDRNPKLKIRNFLIGKTDALSQEHLCLINNSYQEKLNALKERECEIGIFWSSKHKAVFARAGQDDLRSTFDAAVLYSRSPKEVGKALSLYAKFLLQVQMGYQGTNYPNLHLAPDEIQKRKAEAERYINHIANPDHAERDQYIITADRIIKYQHYAKGLKSIIVDKKAGAAYKEYMANHNVDTVMLVLLSLNPYERHFFNLLYQDRIEKVYSRTTLDSSIEGLRNKFLAHSRVSTSSTAATTSALESQKVAPPSAPLNAQKALPLPPVSTSISSATDDKKRDAANKIPYFSPQFVYDRALATCIEPGRRRTLTLYARFILQARNNDNAVAFGEKIQEALSYIKVAMHPGCPYHVYASNLVIVLNKLDTDRYKTTLAAAIKTSPDSVIAMLLRTLELDYYSYYEGLKAGLNLSSEQLEPLINQENVVEDKLIQLKFIEATQKHVKDAKDVPNNSFGFRLLAPPTFRETLAPTGIDRLRPNDDDILTGVSLSKDL